MISSAGLCLYNTRNRILQKDIVIVNGWTMFSLTFLFVVLNFINYFFPTYSLNLILFIITHIFIIFSLIMALFNLRKNLIFFLFIGCMFTFLLGRNFLTFIDTGVFDVFTKFHVLVLSYANYNIYISTIFYSIATLFWVNFFWVNVKHKKEKCRNNVLNPKILKRIIKFGFYIFLPFEVVTQLGTLYMRFMYSYDAVLAMDSIVPLIIRYGASFFFVFSLLYLATRPKKREMFFVLFCTLIFDGFINLLGGARFEIAKYFLFMIVYIFLYDKNESKKIISKKMIIYVICLGVIAVSGFGALEYIRGGKKVDKSFFSLIFYFFDSVGGSDGVIANAIEYKDYFPKAGYVYFFNTINKILFDNSISRAVLDFLFGKSTFVPTVQGAEYLAYYDDFAHWLTSIVNYERYIAGNGMGSAYIAETWMAFGLPGIFVFNTVLGVIIVKLNNMNLRNGKICINTILLMICYNLFGLPRSSPFSLINQIVYLIIAYFGCYLLSRFFKR